MQPTGGLILDVTPFEGEFDRSFLERLGHPVLVCHGPAMGHLCPILKDGCEMVNAAHGIVFQLDLERPQHRAILARYKTVVSEDTPIVAVVHAGQRAKYRELLQDVHVWDEEPTAASLDGIAAEVEASDLSRQ
jgi:hypothetical protein